MKKTNKLQELELLKKCEYCKIQFKQIHKSSHQKFCSVKCRNKSYYAKKADSLKEWRKQNLEKYRMQILRGMEYKRIKYHKDEGYRKKTLERNRKYYKENKEWINSKHRAYYKEYSKTPEYHKHRREYYKKNKKRFADYQRKHYQDNIKKLGGACFLCGFDTKLHLHHKIPKSQGGSNKLENLTLLCPNHHEMLHRGMISTKSLEI